MIPLYIKNSSFYQKLRCLIKQIKFSYYFNSCLILLLGLSSNNLFAQIQATGGTGKYRNNIYWLNFNELSMSSTDSKTFTFTVNGITVTVIIDQVNFSGGNSASRLIPYISGTYFEERLNRLYNIGGDGSSNTLVNAIHTNQDGVDADFRIRTYASVNGQPADIGLVFGNAEADAPAKQKNRIQSGQTIRHT